MLAVARIAQGVDIAGFAGPDAVKLVAPAKVNLFLDIGAKRADGYHEAVSIMHALMLHDVLRMKLAPGRGEGLSVDLSCVAREGLAMLDVPVESNIVAKAVRLLAEKLERTADETVVACLEKHIPAEAGLGGGSSDAAAALLGAAHLWRACRRSAYRGSSTKPGCRRGVFPAWRLRLLHGRGRCVRPCPCAHERQRRAREARGRRVHGCRVPRVRRASTANSEADREAALEAQRAADVPLRNNLVPVSEHLLPALVDIRLWASERVDVQRVLMSGSGSAVFMQCATFADAGRVAAEARMRGWWARATMFGSACGRGAEPLKFRQPDAFAKSKCYDSVYQSVVIS
ncbi:MAG: 4-(cytidine 5'-diphospho)-2-C-methyl-D-erythritol kinase [Eggerthellaceae bacterium]